MSYIVLILLISVSIILSILTSNQLTLKLFINNLSTNLISEFLGAAAIAIFVERILRHKEKKEKERAKAIAYKKIAFPLANYLECFIQIVNSQDPSAINKKAESLREIFNDAFFHALKNSDLKKQGNAWPPQSWATVLTQRSRGFQFLVDKIIDLYGAYFEVSELEILENVNSSFMMNLFANIEAMLHGPAPVNIGNPLAAINLIEEIQKYVFSCIELSEELERYGNSQTFSPNSILERALPDFEKMKEKIETLIKKAENNKG